MIIRNVKVKAKLTNNSKKLFSLGIFFVALVIIILLGNLLDSAPAKAINSQITFQGKLSDSSGNAVANGTTYLKLTIYSASSGGSVLYTATSTDGTPTGTPTSTPVTTSSGIFSINLGDTSVNLNSIPATLFNNTTLYLGVTACSGAGSGCDSEMTPRKRLTAAPYAFNADYLSGLATSTSGGNGAYIPATDGSGNLKISNSFFVATSTSGQIGFGTSTVPSGIKVFLDSTTASDKLIVVRANSSQTGNLTEWQNNSGEALTYLDTSGNIFIGDGSTSSTLQSNLLRVAYSSSNAMGKFYVDSSGNVSASGTLQAFGNTTLQGSLSVTSNTSSLRSIKLSSLTLAPDVAAGTLYFNSTDGKFYGYTSAGTAVDLGATGGGTNDWGRFSSTYGALALQTSSTYPVWFDNKVYASSSIKIAGGTNSYLDIGGDGNGIGQLFIKSTSTISVPLSIRANALQTGNLTEWQDSSGNVIGNFASSSVLAPFGFPTASALTVGNSATAGVMDIQNQGGILFRVGGGVLAGILTYDHLSLSNGTSNTSTYALDSITLSTISGYALGRFYADGTTGNIAASGTLKVFGGSTSGGLTISATDTTTTLSSAVSDSTGATAFAFNSSVTMTSGTDRMLAVFQNNGTNKVTISAGGNVYAKDSFIANSSGYGIGDVAEYINLTAGETAEAGDVLLVDTTGLNTYKKSDIAYAKNVAGVISNTGAFMMGSSGEGRAPLALAGLVKVKADTENGKIKVGDYLVTATKPGYAMKYDSDSGKSAGLVGMALENLDHDEGIITILVNKGLVAGSSTGGTVLNATNSNSQLTLNSNMDLNGLNLLNVASIKGKGGKWEIDENGNFISQSIKTDKLQSQQLVIQKNQDASKSTIGEGTIKLNSALTTIENPEVTTSTKIFITFRNNPKSFWWISKQEQGKFEVSLSQTTSEDVIFDYWLLGVAENSDSQPPADVLPSVDPNLQIPPANVSIPSPAPNTVPANTTTTPPTDSTNSAPPATVSTPAPENPPSASSTPAQPTDATTP